MMKGYMQDYYKPGRAIKDRACIKQANSLKRWNISQSKIERIAYAAFCLAKVTITFPLTTLS